MKVKEHIVISTVAGGILYMVLRSFPIAFTAAVAGVILDVDHVYDLVKNPKIRMTLKEILNNQKELEKYLRIILEEKGVVA